MKLRLLSIIILTDAEIKYRKQQKSSERKVSQFLWNLDEWQKFYQQMFSSVVAFCSTFYADKAKATKVFPTFE